MGGVIILVMLFFRTGMSRVLLVAAFLVALLVVTAVVGQVPESVLSGEEGIEVVSPAGVTTFEGELRLPL